MLRDYQQRSIDLLYDWFRENQSGHPCIVLPMGAGKSHVIAALCKGALQSWPETRILMLTDRSKLIEQNAEKMRQAWPGAPMGIYSAGLRKRELSEPITFAGIQSVCRRAQDIGHIDLVIIDEAHTVNHEDVGIYRRLLSELLAINPGMRVIGLTATPYRLGHGLITDGDEALFSDLIEPVTIEELVYRGFLAPVRSKVTEMTLDTKGVSKRRGEFIEKELQAAVNVPLQNEEAVREVIRLAGDRRAWLFFCTGVNHAEAIAELLNSHGVTAGSITGEMRTAQREQILSDYMTGKIKALTNADLLTTGFDYPDIDLIALLRPTMSPSLYMQMVGRGMRLKSHTDHCLVLDFAGCVKQHGPITHVAPPEKRGKGGGEAPTKDCPKCGEILHASAKVCAQCGHEFPAPEKKHQLSNLDIMGSGLQEMNVTDWRWSTQVSRKTKIEMLVVTYYGFLSDKPIKDYMTVKHSGFPGISARRLLSELASRDAAVKASVDNCETLADVAKAMQKLPAPDLIKYIKKDRFPEIKERVFDER